MQRETWFRLNCIVTRKQDEPELVEALCGRQLGASHDLPELELPNELYLGEYPWHESLVQIGDWWRPNKFRKIPVETKPTVIDFSHSSTEYDYSMENTVSVAMPAPWLAEALRLRLSDGRRLTFVNRDGEIKFFDPSVLEPGPQAALVDREGFLAALEEHDLAAVWVIAGEKGVFGNRDKDGAWGGRLLHTHVYQLTKSGFVCHKHREKELPDEEQIAALLRQ